MTDADVPMYGHKDMSNHRHIEVRIRVSVLIRDQHGRLLMVQHRKDGRDHWLLPGGGQAPFEALEATARRELAEELKLVSIGTLTFVGLREVMSEQAGRHIVFALFAASHVDCSTLELGTDPRVVGFAWIDAARLTTLPVQPAIGDDLAAWLNERPIPSYRQLTWQN